MESLRHIQTLVEGLQRKVEAELVLLLETSGDIIAKAGFKSPKDISPLGSLLVGVGAASDQLGKLLGERNSPILVQEGEKFHLLSSFIEGDVILAIFVVQKEKIEFVRFKVKQYRVVLKALVERFKVERRTLVNPLANVTEEELNRFLVF